MKILYTHRQIQNKIKIIANKLNTQYSDEQVTILCVLNGSIMFCSDLIKLLNFDITLQTIKVNSYINNKQQQLSLELNYDLQYIQNHNIIIVEDIIDSGNTINWLKQDLINNKCKSITTVSLLVKNKIKHAKLHDICAFIVDDNDYVYGYGMDDNNNKRNLKDIYVK